jgi:hypothetical protein
LVASAGVGTGFWTFPVRSSRVRARAAEGVTTAPCAPASKPDRAHALVRECSAADNLAHAGLEAPLAVVPIGVSFVLSSYFLARVARLVPSDTASDAPTYWKTRFCSEMASNAKHGGHVRECPIPHHQRKTGVLFVELFVRRVGQKRQRSVDVEPATSCTESTRWRSR